MQVQGAKGGWVGYIGI